MTKVISTTVSDQFLELKEKYGISWAEAVRVGIAIISLSLGETRFLNPLNRSRIKLLAKNAGLKIMENEPSSE